jgi:cytidyltransferase-like protein
MGALFDQRIIGIKSGTFTILHPGHVWMLQECAKQCSIFIVLINSDYYLRRKKGVVPIDWCGRRDILSAIKGVDWVGKFDQDTEDEWIKDFKNNTMSFRYPDHKLIVFHSIETKGKDFIPGAAYADKIVYIPRIEGSTTEIFDVIRENKNGY